MPRRARRGGGVPRAVPERLRDRRPVPAGHAARGRARGDRRDRRGQRRPDAGARGRCAAGARHPGAQLRGGDPSRPGAGRGAEVLPADLPGVLRASLVRARRRPARLHDHRQRCRGAVRARPDLPGGRRPRPRPARRGLRGHVGAGATQRRGRARGRHGARQPLRQPDHGGPRRGPPAAGPQRQLPVQRGVRLRRRRPGGVVDRPLVGRADDGLRVRRPAGRDRAVPRRTAAVGHRRRPRPDPPGAAAAGHVRRQPARRRDPRVPHGRLRARPSRRRHRAAPQGRPLPVRARRPASGWRSTATRPTTSRSPGSSSGSTRSASPRSSSASAAASTPPTP